MLSLIVQEARDIAMARQDALNDWRAKQEVYKDSEARTRQVQTTKQVEETFRSSLEEVLADGNIFFKKSAGDSPKTQQWNDAIELREQAVRRILLESNPKDIARYVVDGFTARDHRKLIRSQGEQIQKLSRQIKDMTAVKPTVNNRAPSVVARQDDTPETRTVLELANDIWKGGLK